MASSFLGEGVECRGLLLSTGHLEVQYRRRRFFTCFRCAEWRLDSAFLFSCITVPRIIGHFARRYVFGARGGVYVHPPILPIVCRLEMIWLRVMIRWGFGMRVSIGQRGQDHRWG